MKKATVILLVILLALALLVSCSDKGPSVPEKDPTVFIEEPPDDNAYSYDSYSDLRLALKEKDSAEYAILRKDQSKYGTVYQKTLSILDTRETEIAIPMVNGQKLALRNREGYSNITLFTCELYRLPWLWYHCVIDEYQLDFKVSYLNAIEGLEWTTEDSYYDILMVIAPDAPSPNNYKQFTSYQSIYERTLQLGDGTNVVAMISDIKDSSESYVKFRYNDMLVSLRGEKKLFTDVFWKSFYIDLGI